MDSHQPFFTMIAQASQEHRFATILVEFALQMTGLLDQINKVEKTWSSAHIDGGSLKGLNFRIPSNSFVCEQALLGDQLLLEW